MSEYSLMRSKKNAEMLNAMANVRKDLYEWKPNSPNFFKLSKHNPQFQQQLPPPSQRLKSIESASNRSGSVKRSDSMKDLNQKTSNKAQSTRAHSTKYKTNSDLNVEDMNIHNLNDSDEKLYLSSARNSSLFTITKKTRNEIELELVFINILFNFNQIFSN